MSRNSSALGDGFFVVWRVVGEEVGVVVNEVAHFEEPRSPNAGVQV